MRILFLGAGAVGGYFGGRMAASGADVTFLVRERRQQQLSDGLRIDSPMGNATIPVRTILAGQPAAPFDVIVLTSKAYGLDGALDAITPHVRPGTAILPLLNGVSHVETIEARFPEAITLGGVAQIPAALRPDGSVNHYGKLAAMIVGPRPGQDAARPLAEAFVETARQAGIDAKLSETIEQDRWDKWVFLASLAASTCLMRGDVGTIMATDHGALLMSGLLDECTAVAEAEGHRPSDERMAFYRGQLMARDGRFRASMLHDLECGNPTEADHILGDMIRRAENHGIAVPYLKIALSHLQVYEAVTLRAKDAGK